jgi:hypothetical protein
LKRALHPSFQVTATVCAPLLHANGWDAHAVDHMVATAERGTHLVVSRRPPF